MVLAQIATVIITWPLWAVRLPASGQPNLPVVDVFQLPFGWAMLISAVLPILNRRWRPWVHLFVLVTASCFDQFRLQPQFYFNWLLIWSACSENGQRVLRWALIAMWLWAGLHKLVSPEWLGWRSWDFLYRSGWGLEQFHLALAVAIGLAEISVGVLALAKPKWVAVGCVLLHLGIVGLLIVNVQNYSVLPWNLATAI